MSFAFCPTIQPRIAPLIPAAESCLRAAPPLSASRLASRSTSLKFRVPLAPCSVFCMLKIVVPWLEFSARQPVSAQFLSTARKLSCGTLRAPSSLSIALSFSSTPVSMLCSGCASPQRWLVRPSFAGVFRPLAF